METRQVTPNARLDFCCTGRQICLCTCCDTFLTICSCAANRTAAGPCYPAISIPCRKEVPDGVGCLYAGTPCIMHSKTPSLRDTQGHQVPWYTLSKGGISGICNHTIPKLNCWNNLFSEMKKTMYPYVTTVSQQQSDSCSCFNSLKIILRYIRIPWQIKILCLMPNKSLIMYLKDTFKLSSRKLCWQMRILQIQMKSLGNTKHDATAVIPFKGVQASAMKDMRTTKKTLCRKSKGLMTDAARSIAPFQCFSCRVFPFSWCNVWRRRRT